MDRDVAAAVADHLRHGPACSLLRVVDLAQEFDAAARWIRVAGTSVGLAGAFVLVGSVALALPDAGTILPITLIDFATLTAVAVFFRIPAARLGAGACLVLAYAVGFHLWKGDVGWRGPDTAALMRGLLASNTAAAFVPMFILAMGIAELLKRRWQRNADAFFYTIVGCAVGASSVLLATWHGFGAARDHGAAWYLPVPHRSRVLDRMADAMARGGADQRALLLSRSVQAFVFRSWWAVQFPWQFALLAYATVAVGSAVCAPETRASGGCSRVRSFAPRLSRRSPRC